MLRLVIGGVTLAAAAFAVKEYCEEEGCPWDEEYSSSSTTTRDTTKDTKEMLITKSKEFHKTKKELYKPVMKAYNEYLVKYEIDEESAEVDTKLKREKFADESIDTQAQEYIDKILNTLDILTYNLSLGLRIIVGDDKPDDATVEKLDKYAKSIYNLSHLQLFNTNHELNQTEILSCLVDAMSLATQRESIHVDLSLS